MKKKNPKKHLSRTSKYKLYQKNKFEPVWELIKDTFDMFSASQSKLDLSFRYDQFSIPGYRIVRKDRARNGGGLLLYISESIPFKVIQIRAFPLL